jgi:acyl phosphate:glycerol-3-phosphate acyltransferase
MPVWSAVAYLSLAFLSGSVPYSWLLGRLRGVDLRHSGSGNAGATNLVRTCGRSWGGLGLLLDAAKGALPPLLVKLAVFGGVPGNLDLTMSLAMVFAVLGHVYSPWLGFRGGKGVATTLGALLVIAPETVGVGLVVFAAVFAAWRIVSLASVSGALSLVPAALLLESGRTAVEALIAAVAIFIVAKHASNLRRLIRGEEKRFGGGRRDG